MRRASLSACLALLLPAAGVFAAESTAGARAFGAPQATPAVPPGTASGLAQVTLALLVVLVAVFVVAVLVRRFRNLANGGSHGIEVLAQAALGQRERAVIIRVGATRLLLGVTPGQVTLLHSLPADVELADGPQDVQAAAARPGFAGLLRKSLGR